MFPHFNYCEVLMSELAVDLSDTLQRAQNYCIMFIFALKRKDHVPPFLNKLIVMLKLSEIRQYHILCTMQTKSTT